MEDKEDGGLALGADINHELLASILVEEPLTAPPPPSSLFEELTSSLMDSANMDLYLECDDDKSYAVPLQQQDLSLHSLLGSNVNMRISFPTPPSDVGLPMNLDMTLKKHIAGVPFTCHICMKTYVSKYALKRHIATHSDERPFICSFPDCKGAFKLKSRLTDHIRYVHKRKTARTASRTFGSEN
nr:hypothetical protein BaRGS_002006 [Batillaria attramentaria]